MEKIDLIALYIGAPVLFFLAGLFGIVGVA